MDERLQTDEQSPQPGGRVRGFLARLGIGGSKKTPETAQPSLPPLQAAAERAYNLTYGHAVATLYSPYPAAKAAYKAFADKKKTMIAGHLQSRTSKDQSPDELKESADDYARQGRERARQLNDLALEASKAMTGHGPRTVILDVSQEAYPRNPDQSYYDSGPVYDLYEVLGATPPSGTDPETRRQDKTRATSRQIASSPYGINVVESWRSGSVRDLIQDLDVRIPEGLPKNQPFGEVHMIEFIPQEQQSGPAPAA